VILVGKEERGEGGKRTQCSRRKSEEVKKEG
jgi:hypothetical protein